MENTQTGCIMTVMAKSHKHSCPRYDSKPRSLSHSVNG